MTTIDSSPQSASDSTVGRLLATDVDWLTSTDHKKIGRMFIGGGLLGLLATVVVNVFIAIERVDGGSAALDRDSWMQLLSAQRVGLVFGAALPLAAGLALAVTPLQLGSRALAFPRLAASGMYMWLGGLILAIVSIAANGGIGGGDADMVDLFLASHGLMALGFSAVGVSLATTVLTTRAPGMTMRRVPFFAWSSMVFGLSLVLVMPVLLGTIVYLFVDHRSGTREAFGGNDGIATWAGWIFTQPTTFLLAIPALGVFVELLPVTFKKRTPARGIVFAALALVGVGALAGTTQQISFEVPWAGTDLYIGGGDDISRKIQDLLPWLIFHGLPILGVGALVLMGLFLARPEKNDDGSTVTPNLTGGFLLAAAGYAMVLVGIHGSALTPIEDLGLGGTVFSEGSLLYIAYGTALGVMGGVALWAPKLWGRLVGFGMVAPLALAGLGGTILAAFPLYIAGFLDQPESLGYQNSDLQIWNVLALVGQLLMALTVVGFVGLLARAVFSGDDESVADDPYDGHTIEWTTTSPAPAHNFVDVPTINSAEPLLDLREPAAAPGSDR